MVHLSHVSKYYPEHDSKMGWSIYFQLSGDDYARFQFDSENSAKLAIRTLLVIKSMGLDKAYDIHKNGKVVEV